LAELPQKRVAGLALFYCGCNQSKSLHICDGKDTTKKRKTKIENGKLSFFLLPLYQITIKTPQKKLL
jgi:hypothetical protein